MPPFLMKCFFKFFLIALLQGVYKACCAITYSNFFLRLVLSERIYFVCIIVLLEPLITLSKTHG